MSDEQKLTHLDDEGSARMVDVGGKEQTERIAVAEARVRMSEATAAAVARGDAPKGDVIGTARLAGIQAAKRTADLIPLAHPLALNFVDVTAHIDVAAGCVTLTGEARTVGRTGVELEALTACSDRRADRLRHGQGDRKGRRDRAHRPRLQVRRAQRRLGARGLRR